MNSEDPRVGVPVSSELEPEVAEACRHALSPETSLREMMRVARTIASLVRTLRKERTEFGITRPIPAALFSQIGAVRDLVVREATNPNQPDAMALRLHRLVIALTMAAERIRPAEPAQALPPAIIVPTHPATISRWVH